MKKKILFAFISSLLIFTASGCKRRIRLKNVPPTTMSVNKIGKFVKNYNLDFNDVTFKQNLEDVLEEIKGSNLNYDEIYNLIYKVYKKVSELNKKFYIADALYYYDMSNEEYKTKRGILSNAYYEYESFLANVTYELKDNRELLKELLGVISDEDLDFEIELAIKKKEDKYIELKKEIDDISLEYDELDPSLDDISKDDKVADILFRFVNKNKELSSYLGFDSYIKYRDIEYKRTYNISDSDDFIKNVKKYIIPKMDENRNVIPLYDKISNLSYGQYNYLIEFDETSVYDKDYKTLNLAKDYSKKVGGDYYKTFSNFLSNGNYVFANNSSSLNSGYTSPYFSYFGPDYQNVNTLIHEFGHYYSTNTGFASIKSLDMQEFYSQANEYLFMSYLEQSAYKNVVDVYDVLSCYKIDEACINMLVGSSLREFEEEIYSKEITNITEFKDIWQDLNKNEYNYLLDNYWKFEVRYDNYYLSYATSVTGALSLYTYSKTNLNDAINKYVHACHNMDDSDLVEILDIIKLSGPFDEETFKNIEKLIEEKR